MYGLSFKRVGSSAEDDLAEEDYPTWPAAKQNLIGLLEWIVEDGGDWTTRDRRNFNLAVRAVKGWSIPDDSDFCKLVEVETSIGTWFYWITKR